MAELLPFKNKQTGKVQDLTREQADLFPGLYAPLKEEPKTVLGEDEGSTPNSHDEVAPTVGPTKTGD